MVFANKVNEIEIVTLQKEEILELMKEGNLWVQ
jgi:hypothetical protein